MLERGQRKHPYPYTARALADALELSKEERAVLTEAVSERSSDAPVFVEETAPPSASEGGGGTSKQHLRRPKTSEFRGPKLLRLGPLPVVLLLRRSRTRS